MTRRAHWITGYFDGTPRARALFRDSARYAYPLVVSDKPLTTKQIRQRLPGCELREPPRYLEAIRARIREFVDLGLVTEIRANATKSLFAATDELRQLFRLVGYDSPNAFIATDKRYKNRHQPIAYRARFRRDVPTQTTGPEELLKLRGISA